MAREKTPEENAADNERKQLVEEKKNLKKEHQFELANKLVDAKKRVNGLTDGWFEFKNEFEVAIKQYKSILNNLNLELALFLIKTIKLSLER